MHIARFSERETEQYLVGPFIDALGYESRNPAEVVMEFPIRIGSSVKYCDYAIKLHERIHILVECKKASTSLDDSGQLASYFSQVSTAVVGIYTNGTEYRFYTELVQERVKQMDAEPFLVFNLHNFSRGDIDTLLKCTKSSLNDVDAFLKWVRELQDTRTVQERLHKELLISPSSEFVRLVMGWAGVREVTPNQLDHYGNIVLDAARRILRSSTSFPEANPGHAIIQTIANPPIMQNREVSLDKILPLVQPKGRNAPKSIVFRNGREVRLSSWRHMMEEIAYWLYQEGKLTIGNCEIESTTHNRRRILSSNETEFRGGGAPVKGTGIRMNTQFGGESFVTNACGLLRRFGEDPSLVRLRLP